MSDALTCLDREAWKNLCGRLGVVGAEVEPLPGGRNNRIFRLRANRTDLLVKSYFHHPDDPRDRLGQEFGFLTYLWSDGVRCIPQPVWADPERRLGVYGFLPGRKLRMEEVQPEHVDQAAAFYLRINEERQQWAARRLPPASEACFSVLDHLRCVAERVERLQSISDQSHADRLARNFAESELVPRWQEVQAAVRSRWEESGRLEEELNEDFRCLSPSDFGFHNALVDEGGVVYFVDFEYAGWDDPAKLVCDFGNQPDILLPEGTGRRFELAVLEREKADSRLAKRIGWLRPLYQIKWSCIILNIFLPAADSRAAFLGARIGEEEKIRQLEKSRHMLRRAQTALQETCR